MFAARSARSRSSASRCPSCCRPRAARSPTRSAGAHVDTKCDDAGEGFELVPAHVVPRPVVPPVKAHVAASLRFLPWGMASARPAVMSRRCLSGTAGHLTCRRGQCGQEQAEQPAGRPWQRRGSRDAESGTRRRAQSSRAQLLREAARARSSRAGGERERCASRSGGRPGDPALAGAFKSSRRALAQRRSAGSAGARPPRAAEGCAGAGPEPALSLLARRETDGALRGSEAALAA